jgi:hypothetical protein
MKPSPFFFVTDLLPAHALTFVLGTVPVEQQNKNCKKSPHKKALY